MELSHYATIMQPLNTPIDLLCRWVDLLFNAWAIPLQGLSLLVLPLPWTLPRLLSVQLAVPIAITEGERDDS